MKVSQVPFPSQFLHLFCIGTVIIVLTLQTDFFFFFYTSQEFHRVFLLIQELHLNVKACHFHLALTPSMLSKTLKAFLSVSLTSPRVPVRRLH